MKIRMPSKVKKHLILLLLPSYCMFYQSIIILWNLQVDFNVVGCHFCGLVKFLFNNLFYGFLINIFNLNTTFNYHSALLKKVKLQNISQQAQKSL